MTTGVKSQFTGGAALHVRCATSFNFENGQPDVLFVFSCTGLGVTLRRPQAQMQATDALMEEQRFVVGPIDSWMTSFAEWAANTTEYR